jgi:MFS family permease
MQKFTLPYGIGGAIMDPEVMKPQKITIWSRNFICVVLTNFMLCLAHFSVNTLVATYATYLGATAVIMGLLTGMFFGISLAMRPVAGPVTTKLDKRKLLIMVFALGAVVNIGYALFDSIVAFVIFRFLNGVQYSLVGSLIMTLASDNLPKEKLASGMGVYGVGGAIGMAFGPMVGVELLEFGTKIKNEGTGFTFVFIFAAAVFALAVIPSAVLTPDKKSKEDIASTGAWYKNIATIHAVPTTIVLFFLVMAYSVYNAYMVNYAKQQGINDISWFFTVLAGVLMLSRPLSGWLGDKLGGAKVILPGMILFGCSFLVVGAAKALPVMLLGAVLAAIGYGSTQPSLQAMCIQTVTPLKRGVASNTIYIGMDLGFFLGPLLGSVIYEISSKYSLVYTLTAVPVALAFICFVIILPIHKRRMRELEAVETK